MSGNFQLVTYLIELGSKIDHPDDTDTTPLILAASGGRLEIVKFLISKDAKINQQTNQGHSALQYACSKGWQDVNW